MSGRPRASTYDVVVVGGGPAGCAAAITASRAGARVVLLEREAVAQDRPGESLHPGIEPLLEWLGAGDLLATAALGRHRGHWVTALGGRQFVPFGGDASGAWLGWQVWRPTFDAGLRRRAAELGVEVRSGVGAVRLVRGKDGLVTGVVTDTEECLTCSVVVDASGGRHWLARKLGLGVTQLSPRYVASFGYTAPAGADVGRLPRDPELRSERDGWTWIAPLGARGWHWTRLSFAGKRAAADWVPSSLAGLRPVGASRGADVTWRMVRSVAGPGWVVAGDAGAVLDPASSHGVLRALLSGARAGTLAAAARSNEAGPTGLAVEFETWFRNGVRQDAERLAASYRSWRPIATSSR